MHAAIAGDHGDDSKSFMFDWNEWLHDRHNVTKFPNNNKEYLGKAI